MKLPNKDKLLHFICGTYIYLIASVLLTPMLSILLVIMQDLQRKFIWDKMVRIKGRIRVDGYKFTIVGGRNGNDTVVGDNQTKKIIPF